MANGRPSKIIHIAGRPYQISGLSHDDVYFRAIGDVFEPEFLRICRDLVRPDYTCIDVGANIGMKSLMLAQFVPQGHVLAVEAAPTVYEVLETNVARSGETVIACIRTALGGEDGEVHFREDSAYGHIAPSGATVPCRTLGTLIRERGLSRADFIKIDVEGFEFPILRAGLGEIERHRSVVFFEFNSWCQMAFAESPPLDFARWILASFSHVFLVRRDRGDGPGLRRMRPDAALTLLHTNLIEDGCVSDILATSAPERLPAALR